MTDLAGRIRHFNRRFARLWELPDALLGQRDDAAIWAWMGRQVVDPVRYRQRLDALDGPSRWAPPATC